MSLRVSLLSSGSITAANHQELPSSTIADNSDHPPSVNGDRRRTRSDTNTASASGVSRAGDNQDVSTALLATAVASQKNSDVPLNDTQC